jgi:N-acetylmuramoyl-L-alanine amidase
MQIQNHLLTGDSIRLVESPNRGGKFKARLPDAIIIHYTAGADAASSIRSLCNPQSKASAHLLVARDGQITQLVPFDTAAWHAGKSSYGGREGYNNYSIGIEIDNAGLLTKTGESYQSWFGRNYSADQVITAVHRNEKNARYWHVYSEAQIAAVEDICSLLIDKYGIKQILGHEEISPGRKVDPGPAFPLDKLRDRLLNQSRNEDGPAEEPLPEKGTVVADTLNIRIGPSSTAAVAALPLKKDTSVTILQEKDGWYEVAVEVKGWVSAKYVSPL